MSSAKNGYQLATNRADPGWLEWDVAGNAYEEFNYSFIGRTRPGRGRPICPA